VRPLHRVGPAHGDGPEGACAGRARVRRRGLQARAAGVGASAARNKAPQPRLSASRRSPLPPSSSRAAVPDPRVGLRGGRGEPGARRRAA
jgi:hypothetical protein